MDFSAQYIKKFLSLAIVFVACLELLTAQNVNPVLKYEINVTAQNELEVVVKPIVNSGFRNFVFPKQMPNYYKQEVQKNKIFDFIISSGNQVVSINQQTDTIPLPNYFDFISYKVKLDALTAADFAPIMSFSINDEVKLLNVSTFFAYVDTKNTSIELEIKQNGKSVFNQIETFAYFQQDPICIGCQKQIINTDYGQLAIDFYTTKLESNQLILNIKKALEGFSFLEYKRTFKGKKLIFLEDSVSNNTGAITHKNTIVFYFNNESNFTIQKTILHELIHWAVPYNNSWLNEGAAEFLSLKLLRKAAVISEDEFLANMSLKMREADLVKEYSVLDLYTKNTLLDQETNYRALYSKGAVMAWLLDIIIFESGNHKVSLESYLMSGLEGKSGVNKDFVDAKILDFEECYVNQNALFSHNQFLNVLGVLFEENKIVEIKTVENILIEKKDEKTILLDNSGLNSLSEGDIILSLNSENTFNDIKRELAESKERVDVFLVLRNGKKMTIKISSAETLNIRKRFVLSFFENRTSEQKSNWLEYIN